MRFWLPGFGQLRTRLLYLVLLALLPACGLVLYGNLEQTKIEKEGLRNQAIATAKLAASSQEHFVQNARHLLMTLTNVTFLTLAQERRFCDVNFQNLRILSPDYADFGLINADGNLFASAAMTNGTMSLTNASLLTKTSKLKRFTVAALEDDSIAKTQTLRFGIPVFATNGTFTRVLYGSVYLRLFSEVLTNLSMPQDSTVTVLDEAGNVVARQPNPKEMVGKNVRDEPFVREVFRTREGTLQAPGLDGIERLYAATTVKDGDGPMLYVAVGIPTRVLYAHANRALLRNSIALALVAAAALGLAWLFARESFLKPVNEIRDAAKEIESGNLQARTKFPEDKNELHELGRNFDVMAENLARREGELRAASEKISSLNAELEKRVADRTRQLEATNSELEAFSYSVSHDLRAPLRHMDGFAQILLTEPSLKENERAQRYLGMITKAAQQMGILIDDLLSFSRMGRKTMAKQNVDMSALVSEAIAESREEQKGREIEWQIGKLPNVEGDGSMLKQVWANLISNALKYSRGRKPARIEVGSREEGEEVVFFVKDNGAGFEMAYADKLFGVFQRLHRDEEFEGTGIGLANVRRIIVRHGGRTWAEGEVDKGATFCFTLPKSK